MDVGWLLIEAEFVAHWAGSSKTISNNRVTGSPVPSIRIGRLTRYPGWPCSNTSDNRPNSRPGRCGFACGKAEAAGCPRLSYPAEADGHG